MEYRKLVLDDSLSYKCIFRDTKVKSFNVPAHTRPQDSRNLFSSRLRRGDGQCFKGRSTRVCERRKKFSPIHL